MKKLLSLLSVLTISGTAIPTTIAASPYQKEETIKNIDINYQQTSNLETLKRNKRQQGGFVKVQWGQPGSVDVRWGQPNNSGVDIQWVERGNVNVGWGRTNQQPTFNPNASSTVNPGRTQGQDLEEFSKGMKEIERLANQQQRRNY